MAEHKGWIGVDLDGTLARYDGWVHELHIGEPVPLMVERVKKWLAEGKTVKVFTARVAPTNALRREATELQIRTGIVEWCVLHIGQALPVTHEKDYAMICLFDDRCVAVEPNTGRMLHESVWHKD